MEIHQIRYFLAVCEQLNFTQAARQCHVTQPSLTRAIQRLEKEFGGYLFWRERQKVELTDLGKLVRPICRKHGKRRKPQKRSQAIWSQGADAPESCNQLRRAC
jgi:LysR family transcriptional regulator, hydrogen peroxide-inducible genes activator